MATNWLVKMICWYLYIMHMMSVCIATKTLYVLPDSESDVNCPSQPCATFHQYFLDNRSVTVISDVQYYFLPGEHNVYDVANLIKIHNVSFIGLGLSPAKLVCSPQKYVAMIHSFNVTIKNLVFNQCSGDLFSQFEIRIAVALLLYECSYCRVEDVKFFGYGFAGINLSLNSYLNNVTIDMTIIKPTVYMCTPKLALIFFGSRSSHNPDSILINRVVISGYSKVCDEYHTSIEIMLKKGNYSTNVILCNLQFYNIDQMALNIQILKANTSVLLNNCSFMHVKHKRSRLLDKVVNVNILSDNVSISLQHCKFNHNIALIITNIFFAFHDKCVHQSTVTIENCNFIDNNGSLLMISNYPIPINCKPIVSFNEKINLAKNDARFLMHFAYVDVYMNSTMEIFKNKVKIYVIQFYICGITITKTVAFISNICSTVIHLKSSVNIPFIKLLDYANITFINISLTNNHQEIVLDSDNTIFPYCIFQYMVSSNDRYYNNISEALKHYSISFSGSQEYMQQNVNNYFYFFDSFNDFLTHCKWLPTALFNGYNPEYINQQIIKVDGHRWAHYKDICYCPHDEDYNCTLDLLGPVYPGQVFKIDLCIPQAVRSQVICVNTAHSSHLPNSACKIAHYTELINTIGNYSQTYNFTIISEAYKACELFLASPLSIIRAVFYVQLSACPIGFTLQNGICDCDPSLPPDIDICYVDLSAVRRPPNTWVTSHILTNDTINYLISDCPMDYCIPYSTNINLVKPDLQCQFNRTGMLCSQCQHPLSMVFASSRCMECTNVHILITIIVIVAGIVLVVLLYVFNLTVTNGTINGIIFYANIISINDSIFLANDNVFKALRVFISFTNLDLGIETCFYDGIDSYAKIWLQLFFPLYLITIAVSIIIASRYSSRILRLTYSRSLPVLGTLFLLSYTGILRVVSTVLFSYSTITHYPSGDKQIVWSIDASTPLFGLKFIALFITCLLLFLLLISFNIILLFTRYLSRFKVINHFKPLLDAFQGSYKDKYCYWVAVQIMYRSIFFSLHVFQLKLRLILANLMLVIFTGYHGYLQPNKLNIVNLQELLMLINVTIIYVVSIQNDEKIFPAITNVMMSLALIQFTIIVLSHFLVYTCQCKFDIKERLTMIFNKKKPNRSSFDVTLLNIPECMHDYKEYQDGLVSDDFNYQN